MNCSGCQVYVSELKFEHFVAGPNEAEIMNQLGHIDIASTYRYIRRHFGERSEHIRTKFPDPPGLKIEEAINEFDFSI